MSDHDRRALFGPHAVLHRHRHRRTHAARPSKEATPMKPSPKQIVKGGQGRTAEDLRMSAEALILCVLAGGLVGLIVLLGHVARWFA